LLLAFLALFVMVFWLTIKSQRLLEAPATLVVDEESLVFGEVWADPAFVWQLPIRNTTSSEVEIIGFDTSCTCSKIDPQCLIIPALGIVNVQLTINLSNRDSKPSDVATDFKLAIRPRIKDIGRQPGWIIRGQVKQPFAIDPPIIDFGESLGRGRPSALRSVAITSALDIADMRAYSDSGFFTTTVNRDATNPRRFRLDVQPSTDVPVGNFKHTVRLQAVTHGDMKFPCALTIVGRAMDAVGLVPESITFGAEKLGSKFHETVLVRSQIGENFAIEAIDTSGTAGIEFEIGRKRADGTQALRICFEVKQLGRQEHTIHVKGKWQQGSLDLPLLVRYQGIPALQEIER
jgi:hypothetical protein